jgi:hypothetical protein
MHHAAERRVGHARGARRAANQGLPQRGQAGRRRASGVSAAARKTSEPSGRLLRAGSSRGGGGSSRGAALVKARVRAAAAPSGAAATTRASPGTPWRHAAPPWAERLRGARTRRPARKMQKRCTMLSARSAQRPGRMSRRLGRAHTAPLATRARSTGWCRRCALRGRAAAAAAASPGTQHHGRPDGLRRRAARRTRRVRHEHPVQVPGQGAHAVRGAPRAQLRAPHRTSPAGASQATRAPAARQPARLPRARVLGCTPRCQLRSSLARGARDVHGALMCPMARR